MSCCDPKSLEFNGNSYGDSNVHASVKVRSVDGLIVTLRVADEFLVTREFPKTCES